MQELIEKQNTEITLLRHENKKLRETMAKQQETLEMQDKALEMDKHHLPIPIILSLVIGTLVIGGCIGMTAASSVLGGLL